MPNVVGVGGLVGTIVAMAVTAVTAGAPAGVAAQGAEGGRAGPRSVLPRAEEIALARSAAPPEVSAGATVLVWGGSAWETAVEGANGATCYVGRSWPESIEPHCFDAEGSRTILPMHLRRTELLHAGRTPAEIEAVLAEGLRTGVFTLPTRPATSYMMSGGQQLISDDGRPVGRWRPHLMIYYPGLTVDDVGGANGTVVVVDPGTPRSNLMIPVEAFVEPEQPGRASPGGG